MYLNLFGATSCSCQGILSWSNKRRVQAKACRAAKPLRGTFLEEIVVDESYFLQATVLQISQCLGHNFIFGELVDGDMHFGLRVFLRLGLDVALQSLAIDRVLVP